MTLRETYSADQLTPEHQNQIRRIEAHLGALLNEYNQIADGYNGSVPVDLDLADQYFERGVREWREALDQLLRIVDHLQTAVPVTDNQEMRVWLEPLRRLQHKRVNTLKQILE